MWLRAAAVADVVPASYYPSMNRLSPFFCQLVVEELLAGKSVRDLLHDHGIAKGTATAFRQVLLENGVELVDLRFGPRTEKRRANMSAAHRRRLAIPPGCRVLCGQIIPQELADQIRQEAYTIKYASSPEAAAAFIRERVSAWSPGAEVQIWTRAQPVPIEPDVPPSIDQVMKRKAQRAPDLPDVRSHNKIPRAARLFTL